MKGSSLVPLSPINCEGFLLHSSIPFLVGAQLKTDVHDLVHLPFELLEKNGFSSAHQYHGTLYGHLRDSLTTINHTHVIMILTKLINC